MEAELRKTRKIAAASLLLLLTLLQAAAIHAQPPCSSCRCGPGGDGYIGSCIPPPMKPKFNFSVGSGLTTPPILLNGKLCIGLFNGTVICIDTASLGSWRTDLSEPVTALESSGGRLYVATAYGHIFVLKPEGEDKPEKFYAGGREISRLLAAEGKLFLVSGQRLVIAINITSRGYLWGYEVESGVEGIAYGSNSLYISTLNGAVLALDSSSGEEKWAFKAEDTAYAPSLSGGALYFGSNDYKVYALKSSSGKPLWTTQLDGNVEKTAVHKGILIASTRRKVYGVEAATGKIRWSFNLTAEAASILECNAYAYIFQKNGGIYILNTENGSLIWRTKIQGTIMDSPLADGKALYVPTTEGTIYAIKPAFNYEVKPEKETIEIKQGEEVGLTIQVNLLEGQPLPVNLSLKGLPQDAEYKFNPKTVYPTGTSHLTIKAGKTTGKYNITITASTYNIKRSITIKLQIKEKKCIIATVTYGSELTPEVNLLRTFRDNLILKSQVGQRFYEAFDAFYYSWSPAVAQYILEHPWLRAPIKALLYPLLASLLAAYYTSTPIAQLNREAAVYVAGTVASALIGTLYLYPPLYIAETIKKRKNKKEKKPHKPNLRPLLAPTCLLILSVILQVSGADQALTITTPLYVLSIIAATPYTLKEITLTKRK